MAPTRVYRIDRSGTISSIRSSRGGYGCREGNEAAAGDRHGRSGDPRGSQGGQEASLGRSALLPAHNADRSDGAFSERKAGIKSWDWAESVRCIAIDSGI